MKAKNLLAVKDEDMGERQVISPTQKKNLRKLGGRGERKHKVRKREAESKMHP